MTATLVTGIAELVTNTVELGAPAADGTPLGLLHDAALLAVDGIVSWVGPAPHAPAADRRIDVAGRSVIPGFVDTHTHLVFAGDRAGEFAARMSGDPYDGGGIADTVRDTSAAADEELRNLLSARVAQLRSQGTTTAEIKSGYALTVAGEQRLLRLAREQSEETTFLGAHVVPPGRGRDDYLELVTGEMLRACRPYARWIDVFCEPSSVHAFDGVEARSVLSAGRRAGLGLRVHANQLSAGPGVALAVELGAASADHCTHLSDADVDALAAGSTVATLLPGVEFSTRAGYPPARRLLDAGATVALATDCNPGSCYTSSMPFVLALAVREMWMTPAEALWAATAGGALALQRADIGALRLGGKADVAVVDAPSYVHIAYRPGMPLVRALEL